MTSPHLITETGGPSVSGVALLLDGSNQGSWTPTATLVPNLNADLLDGLSSGAFIKVDGTSITTGIIPFAFDITVPDEVYGIAWNGSLEVPTKNAIYDKIESILAGTGPFIRLDGTSVTLAPIPFQEGVYIPDDMTVVFGGSGFANGSATINSLDNGFFINGAQDIAGQAVHVYVTAGSAGFGTGFDGGSLFLRGGSPSAPGDYGYVSVGSLGLGTPSHFSLTNPDTLDSLYIYKHLQVDGVAYFNSFSFFYDDISLANDKIISFNGGAFSIGYESIADRMEFNSFSGTDWRFIGRVQIDEASDLEFGDRGTGGSPDAYWLNHKLDLAGRNYTIKGFSNTALNQDGLDINLIAGDANTFIVGAQNGGILNFLGGARTGAGNYGFVRVGNSGTPSFSLTASAAQSSLYIQNDLQVAGTTTAAAINASGDITISKATPALFLTDSGGDDWKIDVITGTFRIFNVTDAVVPLLINSSTYEVTLIGNILISKDRPTITLTDTGAGEDDWTIQNRDGSFQIANLTDSRTMLDVTGAGAVTLGGATAGTTLTYNVASGQVHTWQHNSANIGTWASTGLTALTNITISKSIPALFLTDSGGDDYTIDVSASLLRIRNVTDASNVFQADGSSNVAVSTSYAPQTSAKFFVQDRTTAAAATARAAFTATQEIVISGAFTGGNQRGFLGGVSFIANQNSVAGAAMIGLEGGVTVVSAAGSTQTSLNGLFGTLNFTGGSTITTSRAISTFVSLGTGSIATNLSHFEVGGTQTSGGAVITNLYGFFSPALTSGVNNFEGWMGTDAGWFFREAGNQINSRAAATLDIDATTTANFRIGGTVAATLITNRLTFNGPGTDPYIDWSTSQQLWLVAGTVRMPFDAQIGQSLYFDAGGVLYDYGGAWFSFSASGVPDTGTDIYLPYNPASDFYFGYGGSANYRFGPTGLEFVAYADGAVDVGLSGGLLNFANTAGFSPAGAYDPSAPDGFINVRLDSGTIVAIPYWGI